MRNLRLRASIVRGPPNNKGACCFRAAVHVLQAADMNRRASHHHNHQMPDTAYRCLAAASSAAKLGSSGTVLRG